MCPCSTSAAHLVARVVKGGEEFHKPSRCEQLIELCVRVRAEGGAHDGAGGGSAGERGQQLLVVQRTRYAPREVGQPTAPRERQACATKDTLGTIEQATHAVVKSLVARSELRPEVAEGADNFVHVEFDDALRPRVASRVQRLRVDSAVALTHARPKDIEERGVVFAMARRAQLVKRARDRAALYCGGRRLPSI